MVLLHKSLMLSVNQCINMRAITLLFVMNYIYIMYFNILTPEKVHFDTNIKTTCQHYTLTRSWTLKDESRLILAGVLLITSSPSDLLVKLFY